MVWRYGQSIKYVLLPASSVLVFAIFAALSFWVNYLCDFCALSSLDAMNFCVQYRFVPQNIYALFLLLTYLSTYFFVKHYMKIAKEKHGIRYTHKISAYSAVRLVYLYQLIKDLRQAQDGEARDSSLIAVLEEKEAKTIPGHFLVKLYYMLSIFASAAAFHNIPEIYKYFQRYMYSYFSC